MISTDISVWVSAMLTYVLVLQMCENLSSGEKDDLCCAVFQYYTCSSVVFDVLHEASVSTPSISNFLQVRSRFDYHVKQVKLSHIHKPAGWLIFLDL